MSDIPAPVLARATATWLHGESKAHRLDPIEEVYAEHDYVKVTVCPSARNVWETWCNLLRVDRKRAEWLRGQVTARGSWQGTTVFLTGLHTERWE